MKILQKHTDKMCKYLFFFFNLTFYSSSFHIKTAETTVKKKQTLHNIILFAYITNKNKEKSTFG